MVATKCRPSGACVGLLLVIGASSLLTGQDPVAHWKLAGDTRDDSGQSHHLEARGVNLSVTGPRSQIAGAVGFNGRDSFLEAAPHQQLNPGQGAFSLSAWVHTEAKLDDVLGDVISKFDPDRRTGFELSIKNNVGVTNTSSNYRHVHFGIDNGRLETQWRDHGRPGANMYVFSLLVHRGELYAGTCEPGIDEAGHVYRFAPGRDDDPDRWVDLGTPDRCNAVSTLCSYNGQLYAGTSKYRLGGSSLPESPNLHPGGNVFRYLGDQKWEHCGKLGKAESIYGTVVYRGQLYASALYSPGLFRYDGGTDWTDCGTFQGKRVEALAVYNGAIYATGFDEAGVYRYDGTGWEHLGVVGENTQTYGFAVYRGSLYVSTWPTGSVFRFAGPDRWEFAGRLAMEKEAMPLAIYNGMLYSGTLPLGGVFRYDGATRWTSLGRVDTTPDVRYRRAWSMAVFQGRLYTGALPSGRVKSIEAGKSVTFDQELPSGWVHLAAVREADRLRLSVNGRQVARSAVFRAADYDLTNDAPLRIGLGQHDYFNGRLSDVRLYRRALSPEEIAELAHR